MLESEFQSKLIKEIETIFPGSIVIKNDPTYIQGFPDLTIFYHDQWALLECKKSKDENVQPNQEYYISWANDNGSFGRFIFPENKKEVLHELQQTFRSDR